METPGKKPGMSSKRKQKQSPSYSINSSKSKLNSSLRLNRSTRVNSSAVKTKNRQLAAALGRKSQELEFLKEEFCELRNEHHELKVKALRFHRIAQVTNENIEEVVVGRVQERMCDVSALLNKVSNQLLGAVKLLGTAVEMTTDPKRKSLETLCSNRASSLGANKSDDDSPVIAVPNPKRSIYYDAGSKNPAGRVPQKSSTIPLKPKLSTPAVDIHPAALSAVAASVNDVAGNLHEMSVIVEQSFMGEKMDTLDMNKVNVLDTVEDGENLPEEEVPQEEPNPTSKTSSSLPAPTAPTSENPGSPGKCDADMQNMTVYLDEQMDFTECISVPVGLASFISANSESAEKSVKAEEAEEQKEGRLSSPEDKEDSEDEMDKLKKKLKAMQNVKVFVNDCSKTKTGVSKSENDIATAESAFGKETSGKKTSTKERAKKKAKNQEPSSESRPPCTERPPRESRKSRSKGRQEPHYRELSSDSESETPPSDTSLDSTTSSKSYGIVFNKPGKISFTAGRIDILNGDGKQKSRLPVKVPTKSRSKHKTSSKQRSRTKTKKDEKVTDGAKTQDEPKSVFDYTGTPQTAEEKGVYDMSMNESVQQERLPLSKFRERRLTGTEEASTPSANARSKPRALVSNQTSDPESWCEDKPTRSRTKTIKPKEDTKLEPAAVKSRTKSKRKSSKSDYIEPRKTDYEDQEKSSEKSTCKKDAQTRPTGNSREQITSQTKQAIEDTSVFDSPVRSKTQDDSLVDEENIVIEETPVPLGGSRSKTRLTSEEHVPSVATEKSPVAVKKSRTKTKLDGDNMVKMDHQEDQVGPVPTPSRVTKRGKEVKSKKKHRYTYCVEDLFSGDYNNVFHANNLEIPAPLSEDASEEPEREVVEVHAVEGANHTSPRQDQASKMVQEKKNKKKHRYTYVRPDSGFDEDVAGKTDEKNISENQEGIVIEGQSNEKAKFEDRENTHNTQRTEEKCEMDEKIDGSCQEEPVQEEQSEDTSQDKDKEEKRKLKTKKRSRSVKPSEQEEERQNADDYGVKRPRRAAANVSLKEPSLGGKLRRGDPGTSSIYQGENIPLYKEKNKHKKDAKKRSTLSSITNIKSEHEVV